MFLVIAGISFSQQEIHPDSRFYTSRFDMPDTSLIMAVGDIMLDRNVANFQNARVWHYPFYYIIPHLDEADFLTGNLESMISDQGKPMDKKYVFCANPEQIRLLEIAGFDCLTVGNNHAFDYYQEAFIDCIDRLERADIAVVGGGNNITEALSPKFFDIDGNIIGVIGLNDTKTNFTFPDKPATVPTWGPSWVLSNVLAHVQVASDISDILLVHIHWGDEDTTLPNPNQIAIGHSLVDAGADILIGHHPHRLQPVEFYRSEDSGNEGIIAYSLGNFIFDQNDYLNNLSAIFHVKISDGRIFEVAMRPIEMLTYPRATNIARGEYLRDVYLLMRDICDDFGTVAELNRDSLIVFRRDD